MKKQFALVSPLALLCWSLAAAPAAADIPFTIENAPPASDVEIALTAAAVGKREKVRTSAGGSATLDLDFANLGKKEDVLINVYIEGCETAQRRIVLVGPGGETPKGCRAADQSRGCACGHVGTFVLGPGTRSITVNWQAGSVQTSQQGPASSIQPSFGQYPWGSWESGSLGPFLGVANADDAPMTAGAGTRVFTVRGVLQPPEKIPHELSELNEGFDHKLGIWYLGGSYTQAIGGGAGVAPFRRSGPQSRAGVRPATARMSSQADPQAEGGRSQRRFSPAFSVAVGRADVSLKYQNNPSPASSVNYDGDGVMLALGLSGVLQMCAECRWYSSFGYGFEWLNNPEMTRRPPVRATGGQIVKEQYTFRYKSHAVMGSVGYAFRYVAPWAGLQGKFRRARLDGTYQADFTQFYGFSVTSEVTFRNDFDDDTVGGLAGIDIRFPKTNLFARVGGSHDGNNSSLFFNLVYGFGL